MPPRAAWQGAAFALACLLSCGRAVALDKQSSAHGGQLGGAAQGFALSGSLLLGAAVYNPSYAARPDNTGHVLARFAPHLDIDLVGSRLSVPIDLNVFTDRDRPGWHMLAPSEFDVISGLTSTWPLGRTALELGARVEADLPVDRGTRTQQYADLRARLLYSLAAFAPGVHAALIGGDVTGAITVGVFTYNPSYAARPDNSGLALFRYALHVALRYTPRFFVGFDVAFFTDRRADPFAPSECDLTPELGARLYDGLDLHVAYERDMPVDRGRLVQQLLLVHLSWDFGLVEST